MAAARGQPCLPHLAALAAATVNIKVIVTSEIKISVRIDRIYMELAVQVLHDTFALNRA